MMRFNIYKIKKKALLILGLGTLVVCALLYKKLLADTYISHQESRSFEEHLNTANFHKYHKEKSQFVASNVEEKNAPKHEPHERLNLHALEKPKAPDNIDSKASKNQIQASKDQIEDEKAVKAYRLNRIHHRQLQRGIQRGGNMVLKIANFSTSVYDKSADNRAWQRELGAKDEYELSSVGHLPPKFRPETGNGYISAVVFSHRLHVNNLFVGVARKSRRARFPIIIVRNITRVTVNGKELHPMLRRYSLNMAEGVFTQTLTGTGIIIEQRIYAHRNFTPLLVHEIDIFGEPAHPSEQLAIQVDFDADGDHTVFSDAALAEEPYPKIHFESFLHRSGTLQEQENQEKYPNQPKDIHMMSTELPETLQTTLSSKNKRVKWTFILSVSSTESIAREYFELGLQLVVKGDWLYRTHLDAWRDVWNSGRVQVENSGGVSHFPATLLSAQYYILSSLPWRPHEGYTFHGLSPGGLGHGSGENIRGFKGRTYWDQDMWMFPPVMMLHPRMARQTMLQYRIDQLPRAMKNAKLFGFKGAKFPWESGFTGIELTFDPNNERYQHHVVGAVVMAAVNYVLASNDTKFLLQEGGDHLIMEGARFWQSRLSRVVKKKSKDDKKSTYHYEIWNAMGPDEYHELVNNSAYTNALAQACLKAPARVKRFTKGKVTEEISKMESMAKEIYVPFDESKRYHPEFDGYKIGSKIKQADVVLLGYPLNYIFDLTERRNDLLIYQKVLDNGPGMSWGMHAIGWLELKDEEKAWGAFKQQFMHVRKPFKVWSEYSTGGRVNFLTAAGGFLQSTLNGYLGLRLRIDGLYFEPMLPFQTKTLSVFGLNYLGNSIDIILTDSTINVKCSGYDPSAPRLEAEIFRVSPKPVMLETDSWLKLPRHRGVIRAVPDQSSWPKRTWRLRRNYVDSDIIQVMKLAKHVAGIRQSDIMAWRKRNAEIVKERNKKRQSKPADIPLEEQVAKKLKKKGKKQRIKPKM